MEVTLVILVCVVCIFFAFKNTAISLAIILNIVVFRAIPYVDYSTPRYGYYNENDFLLGAIIPISCFVIILSKLFVIRKKIIFHFDVFDVFMGLLTIIMCFSIFLSPDIYKSLFYTGIFVFLALPYYIVTKIYFLNVNNYKEKFYDFLIAIVTISFIFSLASLYLHAIAMYPYERMTFPGVYPIPFCLLLCVALIILIIRFVKPNFVSGFSRKRKLILSLPVVAIIAFSIIKTNTRGPVFAVILTATTMLFMFFRIKLNSKIILGAIVSFLVGFITFISFFDVKKIAVRFIELAPKDADSFTPRLIGYFDSIIILLTRPLGISVGTFGQYYSNKNMIGKEQDSYAHNLFMELISSFGIFGVVLCFILIYVILFEYNFIVRNQKKIFSDPLFFAVIALLLFFFFETQFSFTLNTHKGFYFSLAMYSVFKYKFLLQKKEEVT